MVLRMFGGYLTFVDSDDYLSPEAFCCWMKHSYADLVVGGYLSFGFRTDKSETYLENLFAVDEQIGKCLTDKIMNLSFRTPWGKLFRAEIVINNNLRFNEQMKLAEDTLFMLGYYQYCTKIATNALVAYHYYIGGGNDHKYALKADPYVLSLQAFDNAYRNISKRLKVDFSALNYFLSSYFCHLYFANNVFNHSFSFRGYKTFKETFSVVQSHLFAGRGMYGFCIKLLKKQIYILPFIILRLVKPSIDGMKRIIHS